MDNAMFDRYREREEHTEALAREALVHQTGLDDQDENVDPSLICWRNLSDDNDRLKVMSGFSCSEFQDLLALVAHAMPTNTGRGRRSKVNNEDKLLMTLCYLKHYETLDKLKETFCLSKSYLHEIITDVIDAIEPILYKHFVEDCEPRTPNDFDDFPEARYVMDVTFQPIWTPLGTYEERKRYFSGKHKQYGLKSQCLHDRQGKLIHCVSGIPGSVHDLTIARQTLDEVNPCLSSFTQTTDSTFSREGQKRRRRALGHSC